MRLMNTAFYGECDTYCDLHAPEGAEPSGFNEADSPLHCSVCHYPLDCTLTDDGIEYVYQALRDELRKGYNEYLKIHSCYDDTYYVNCCHYEILADWAEKLSFTKYDRFADKFIERTSRMRMIHGSTTG